ncbi:MAG: PAS domain S-box protein, partial [Melioribacteraceae bacterium]|nr:PAS domain S-box protein [Melioribacteraceae bacterium]
SSSSIDESGKSVRLNPITLTFPEPLENEFLQNYYSNSLPLIKISAVAGSLLFIAFFLFDLFLIPEFFEYFLALRVGITSLILFFCLLLINKSQNKKIVQPVMSFAVVIIGITNILFMVIAFPKLNSFYYVGIILIHFWAYTFLKLRYLWAAYSGITIFIVYVMTFLFHQPMNTELFLVSSSYLLASNLAGMGIAYSIEYYSRKDFYQNLILQKSLKANIALNEKITQNNKVIDIAEEKLTLQSKALESAANSIVIFNREGNIIWCNKAFTSLTGYEIDEVKGKNPRILKSGKQSNLFYKNLWSTILNGSVWSGEIINKKKNGDLYYEEMIITPVIGNGNGKVSNFIAVKQDISARKEMEENLYESEKRLRELFENATMGIYRSTLSGDVVMANEALIKMLGFNSLEELQNREKMNSGYVQKGQRDLFLEKLKKAGSLTGFESEWRKKDGSIIFIRESARLYEDEMGDVIFEGTVEDITMNKLAESEIKESRERLQVIVDNLYDAIFIHDLDGRILNVNNKVIDMYNVSKEEILKMRIEDISSMNNSMEMVSKRWDSVVKDGKTFKFEWEAMRPLDEFVFDVEVFLSRITLNSEKYILANVRDISDQKEAQKKLLMNQRAVELNASPIFWISSSSKFLYANKAAVNQLGYSFEELLNMRVPDIDPKWSEDFWIDEGFPLLQNKKVANIESYHITKGGKKFPVEINASIMEYDNEEIVIAIVTDITERRKTAESLIEAKEKAEQSDKLKSDFLAGMSHEIRTPINTILNFISLIRSDLGEDMSEDIRSSFEMIDSGSRRLIRTIDSILNMSQLQSGSYDVKSETILLVDEILTPLISEFKQPAEEKHIQFNLENITKEKYVFGDRYTLSQLFINLIDNALKYTERGSVKILVESDEQFIITRITDTGIGISEEFLPTLFEPFLQEEMGYTRSYEGTGLGLALVKNYIELNEGIIEVESVKGAGSTFIVKLKKANLN